MTFDEDAYAEEMAEAAAAEEAIQRERDAMDRALAELWMWVQEQSGKSLDENKLMFAGRLLEQARQLGLWREWREEWNKP